MKLDGLTQRWLQLWLRPLPLHHAASSAGLLSDPARVQRQDRSLEI